MTAEPTFDAGFSTPAIAAVFSPQGRIERMLRAEAALAGAQAEQGDIPAAAAAAITAACRVELDARAVEREGWQAGTPLIPLLDRLRPAIPDEHAGFLHWRATTQDIVDSATMLQIADGLAVLGGLAGASVAALRSVIELSGHMPAVARTLLRPAGRTTFGARAEAWLDPLERSVGELADAARRLPVQLGGPIGDGAGFGDGVAAGLARRLGLVAEARSWHTDRAPVTTVVSVVERAVGWAAKIAHDLILLGQPEVGELTMRPGGSSSIAGKHNPIDAVRALAAADACHGVASIVTRARPHELERAAGSWHAEWFAVPMVFHTASATLDALAGALESLVIERGGTFLG